MRILDTSQKEFLDYICSLDDSCDVPCTNFKVNESDAMIEEYQYMTKQQKQRDDIGSVSQRSNPNPRTRK